MLEQWWYNMSSVLPAVSTHISSRETGLILIVIIIIIIIIITTQLRAEVWKNIGVITNNPAKHEAQHDQIISCYHFLAPQFIDILAWREGRYFWAHSWKILLKCPRHLCPVIKIRPWLRSYFWQGWGWDCSEWVTPSWCPQNITRKPG